MPVLVFMRHKFWKKETKQMKIFPQNLFLINTAAAIGLARKVGRKILPRPPAFATLFKELIAPAGTASIYTVSSEKRRLPDEAVR